MSVGYMPVIISTLFFKKRIGIDTINFPIDTVQ